MKLAVAQINCLLGDLEGNANLILHASEQAHQQGAQLLLTPELGLCGYPPEDLLLRRGFCQACDQALQRLAKKITRIAVVVGHPCVRNGRLYNAASLVRDGNVTATYLKHELPNYAVFDEQRYFDQGSNPAVFEVGGVRFGLNICADIWKPESARMAMEAGAQVLLVLNASPFAVYKQDARYGVIRDRITETGLPVVYANMVGGQDELIFDGGSFAMDARGELLAQAKFFESDLLMVDVVEYLQPVGNNWPTLDVEESVYRALCLGVRDYIGKNRFPGVLLGLSGGIDSALTLVIAVDALGADKVHAVMMPYAYTAQMSMEDSRQIVKTLGVRYDELPIEQIMAGYVSTLSSSFAGHAADTTEENLQARIRGALLMAMSNKFGSLVLTTGNKSEMTVGYATLYGDMAGGFAVLKDVSKTMVYRLARYRNLSSDVIPERIISRAPSAELRPDQSDQDNLPPYEILDDIMACYVEQNLAIPAIIALGYLESDVRKVVNLIRVSEYKRRQSAVGIRITERSYGKDWRYPITARYQDSY
ncbi:MAG: NAD+ synthase [Gallionella sp.]